jgi:hypothetical protein
MKITVSRIHGVATWKWGIDEEVSSSSTVQ